MNLKKVNDFFGFSLSLVGLLKVLLIVLILSNILSCLADK